MFYNIFFDVNQLFIRLNKLFISLFGRKQIIWQKGQSVREGKMTIKKTTPENPPLIRYQALKCLYRNKDDMIFRCSIHK